MVRGNNINFSFVLIKNKTKLRQPKPLNNNHRTFWSVLFTHCSSPTYVSEVIRWKTVNPQDFLPMQRELVSSLMSFNDKMAYLACLKNPEVLLSVTSPETGLRYGQLQLNRLSNYHQLQKLLVCYKLDWHHM